jgi:thiamine pyrophosphate-dependent acetolactate synthase large subunit-like protein
LIVGSVQDAICNELRRQDVVDVFGLIGEDVAALIANLPDYGMRYFSARHENGAVGMADGYARTASRVGVAIVSRGPGLMNALNALKTAAKAHSSVVVLVADSALGLRDPRMRISAARAPKHIEQGAILDACGIANVTLRSPMSAAADIARVFDWARVGETIVVNVPIDILELDAGCEETRVAFGQVVDHGTADLARIAAVADLLEARGAALRPVILAGRGAVRGEARAALEKLGERIGALMATTLLARSMFKDSEYNIGICGAFSTSVAWKLLAQCDVILAFGASLNHLQTFGGELSPEATVVQFDIDPDSFGRFTQVDFAVRGDAHEAASVLIDELAKREFDSVGYRTSGVASEIASFDCRSTFVDTSGADAGLDPRTLLLELDRLLPSDRTHVVDAGHHMASQAQFLSVPDPQGWVWPLDFSSIGSGLAVAIGAALGRPNRLTTLGIGDGGLMMTLGELETAIRYSVPLVIIVIDDSAYGAEVHFMDVRGLSTELAEFPAVNFEAVAKSFGGNAITVASLRQLEVLPELVSRLRGPLVVDCKINRDVRADFVQVWDRLTKPNVSL